MSAVSVAPAGKPHDSSGNKKVSQGSQGGSSTQAAAMGKVGVTRVNKSARRCFVCNQKGHLMLNCPMRKKDSSSKSSPVVGFCAEDSHEEQPATLVQGEVKQGQCQSCEDPAENAILSAYGAHAAVGEVDGQKIVMVRDTGCSLSLVKSTLIDDSAICPGQFRMIATACGHKKTVPMAVIHVQCDKLSLDEEVVVGVMPRLPVEMLVGNDLVRNQEPNAVLVTTRAQAQRDAAEEARAVADERVTEMHANALSDEDDDDADHTVGDGIDEAGGPTVQDHGDHDDEDLEGVDGAEPAFEKISLVDCMNDPGLLQTLQTSDPTLETVRRHAVPERDVAGVRVGFFWRNGLLYRHWRSREDPQQQPVEQLVVPHCLCMEVLHQSHDEPMAGHLGINKTRERVLGKFYWPGIFKDVATYCRTCDACHKSARRM